MDEKTIEKIQARLEADADYRKDLDAYDNMVNMVYDLPSDWETKEWVRPSVSTDAHDAIRTATNVYDTSNPAWEILPRGGVADKDAAEELETVLEWWMDRANKAGEHEPFRMSLHNSCLQNCVIYQLDYLPYWLPKDKKKWSKEQKAAMKASSYCITVHDRRNVCYEMGKYGLKWAAGVTVSYAQDVIDHWSVYASKSTEEGKKVTSAIAKMKKELEDNEELKYVHVDFTSHDKREVTVFPTNSDSLEDFLSYEADSKDHIDIMDCENKMEFINWVVVSGESTPLLYSMHKAGLWSNQNLYDTIINSTTMRRAVFPILKHTSPTRQPLDVEYSGEQDVIELQTGETAEVMVPPPIDSAMATLSGMNTNKTAQATGIKGLAGIEAAGNVAYSSIQAVIKLHMTSLIPYTRTWQKANAQLGDMAFRWLLEGDGFTEIGKRTKTKGDGKDKGMQITVSPKDFDPDELDITCLLVAHTTNDKMEEANYWSVLHNAGAHVAWKRTLEKLGEGNGDVLEAEWLDEQAMTTALQMTVAKLQAELQQTIKQLDAQMQLEMSQIQQQQAMQQEQQMMQQQGQAMPQPQGQVAPDQSNPMMPGGQGMNQAQGGQSTVTSMPGATSPV